MARNTPTLDPKSPQPDQVKDPAASASASDGAAAVSPEGADADPSTSVPAASGPAIDQAKDPAATGIVSDGEGAAPVSGSGAATGTAAPAVGAPEAGQGQPEDSAINVAATITLQKGHSAEPPPEVNADDKGQVTIYPLRSYLDGKEIRRAGGKGYKSPKHDAVSLIAAGLATDKKPKA